MTGISATDMSSDAKWAWLAPLSSASVYAVLVYLINLMFFLPMGDSYLKPLLLLSSLACLAQRKAISEWGTGATRALFIPMVLYTLVLITSYLVNDGFMSTIRIFVFCTVFVYAASIVRPERKYIAILCLIAAIEIFALAGYQMLTLKYYRLSGYTNPIFFGMFAMSMAVVSLYLATAMARRALRWSLYAAALVFCVAAALTGTRGVMISVLPLLIIFCVYCYCRRGAGFKRTLAAIAGLIVLAAVLIPQTSIQQRFAWIDDQVSRVFDNQEEDRAYRSSIGFRLLMWKFSAAVAAEHPLFGVGNERFQQYKDEWVQSGRFPPALTDFLPGAHAHNQYFQDLAMRGVIGLAALLALFGLPAARGVALIRQGAAGPVVNGYMILSLAVGFATFSLTEVALKHPEKVVVFAILGVLALTLGRAADDPERQPT